MNMIRMLVDDIPEFRQWLNKKFSYAVDREKPLEPLAKEVAHVAGDIVECKFGKLFEACMMYFYEELGWTEKE